MQSSTFLEGLEGMACELLAFHAERCALCVAGRDGEQRPALEVCTVDIAAPQRKEVVPREDRVHAERVGGAPRFS